MLLELNHLYSEMGQSAITDFDEFNYHDNAILNIIESKDKQVFFQTDKNWHYNKEERRWMSTNDENSWYILQLNKNRISRTKLHIS